MEYITKIIIKEIMIAINRILVGVGILSIVYFLTYSLVIAILALIAFQTLYSVIEYYFF